MLSSGTEWPSEEVYSSIQKFIGEYHQGPGMPRSRLLRLAGVREKAVQAAGRFGYEVINADRPQEVCPAGRFRGQVVYFSLYPDNAVIRRHLGAGGMAVFMREGQLLAASGCRSRSIIKTTITSRNLSGSSLLEDALAAAAGLIVLGMQPEKVWQKRTLWDTCLADPEKTKNL